MLNRAWRAALLIVGTVGVVTCADGPNGPGSGNPQRANFAFVPQWESSAQRAVAALADDGLTLDRVRIVIVRPAHDTLKDTTVVMHAGDPPITLVLTVNAFSEEELRAGIQFKSGETVYFEGTAVVVAHTLATSAGSGTPTEIKVTYVGPGASATSVTVTPGAGIYSTTGTIQFSAKAFDATNAELPRTPFVWSVSDATLGTISTAGLFTPNGKRGDAVVTAATLKDVPVKGSVTATLAPPPASIVIVSGDNQAAPVTQQLAQPLVAAVLGADKLGVPGQTVTFAATDGGIVTTATVVTDANGQAQTTVKVAARIGAYSFTATSGAFSVGAKGTANLGPAAQMSAVGPTSFTVTSGIAPTTASKVLIADAGDNPVPGFSVTADVTMGAVSQQLTLTSDANGLVSMPSSLALTAAAGVFTAKISSASLTGSPITFTVTVVPGAASAVAINAGSNQSATAGNAVSTKPAVKVTDANGNAVSGVTVTFAVASGGGSITGATPTTGTDGIATVGGWMLGTIVGTNTLTATATGLVGSPVTFTATTSAGTLHHFSVTATDGSAIPSQIAGTAFNVTITAQDANNNTVTGYTGTPTLTSTGTLSAGGGVTAAFTAGVLATKSVTISNTGSFTVTSTDGAVTGSSASFAVAVGAANRLVLTTSAAGAQSGAAFTTQPVLAVHDAAGNPLTSDNSTVVTMTVSTGATVVGAATVTATAGVVTFATVGISGTAGTSYTLTFAATNLTSAMQSITPTAGAASQLVLTTSAAGAPSGAAFTTQPVVAVRDAAGNPVTSDNSTVVTMSVSTGGTVVGSATATASSGVATFTTVGISGTAGTSYTLTFSKSGLNSVTQSITPTAGAASQLVLTTSAAGASSGAAFTTQPVVAVRDAAGNPLTSDNSTVVTMTVSTGATMVGTATVTATAGVVTFTTVGISGTAGTSYTLTFAATNLTSATQSITPTAGTASQLAVTTSAAGAPSGAAFTTQPVVAVRDAAGNTLTSDNSTVVTMTVSTGATMVGTATVTATAGVATFTTVGISGTAGTSYTLTFAATNLTSAMQSITPTAGAASQLVLTTNAAGASSGGAFTTQPVVAVRDAAGNPLTSDNSTVVTMTVSTGATVVGAATTTATAGVVTFTTVGISGTAGTSYTLTFAATNLTSATQSITLSAVPFSALAMGSSQTCALTNAGSAYCWGNNLYGQLGDGTTTTRLTPVPVQTALVFTSLAETEGRQTCGLTSAGVAYCWGLNNYGQLGDGTTTNRTTPVAVQGGLVFTALTAGGFHTCGLTSAGAYCWGYNFNGRLGDGTTTDSWTPVAVGQGGLVFTSLTAGEDHACGLTSAGAAYCWGRNIYGGLGDSTTTERWGPVAVAQGGLVFTAVTAGNWHTCGLTSAGAAYCWGHNSSGQLGDGTLTNRLTPAAVQGGLVFTAMAAGNWHTCGLTTAGAAYCWGNNSDGVIGNGTYSPTYQLTPSAVQGGILFTALTSGNANSCGLTSAGAAYCWGDNGYGALGDGTIGYSRPSPVAVIRP